MSKSFKKLSLFMLILALLFVTACNSGTPAASDPPPADPPAQTPAPSDPPANPPADQPADTPAEPGIADLFAQPAEFSMNGEEIKILVWGGGPQAGTLEGDLILERQAAVEEKYNTKIVWEVLPWGENANRIIEGGLSGEPPADIVLLDLYGAVPLINQGLLLPIDDLFDLDDPRWPEGMREFGSYNGKQYGFLMSVNAGSGIYYNRTLLEREGLPDPHELMAQDQWNWDKFLEILKAATKDTDGDGVTDQWGLVNHAGILARIMLYANGGSIIKQDDSGKWVYSGTDPNSLEAIEFLNDLVNTHKVMMPNTNRNFGDYNDAATTFTAGKAAFVTGELWEGGGHMNAMTDEMGFAYFPKGPKATNYSNVVTNFTMWYMPANAKHPKEVARIWQELQLWDRVEQNKRESNENNMSTEEDVELAMKISDFVNPLIYPGIGIEGDFFNTVWAILHGETAPASGMESIKQTVQSKLDETFNAQ